MNSLLNRNIPEFTTAEIEGIAADAFGIQGNVSRQNTERDLSYRIKPQEGNGWVLKVSNAAEEEGIVDLQVQALAHIATVDPGLQVPRMVNSLAGKPYEWVSAKNGQRHMVRMLTYVPGDVVDTTPAALCAETRYQCGAFIGRLDRVLRNFFHPHANSNRHLWDIRRFLELRDHLHYLTDPQLRSLCEAIFVRAEQHTLPALQHVRHQVIHQDAHSGNVLVLPEDPTQIAGLIDFGDMLYGPVISELAVAVDAFTSEDEDPLQNLCEVTAGFDSTFPLEEVEIDLVFDLALIRQAMTVVIVHSRETADQGETHIENDGNTDRILKLMSAYDPAMAIRRLRAACRFPVHTATGEEASGNTYCSDEMINTRENALGNIWHFYDRPLNFTRGSGPWLYTADGTAYLDAYNNVPQFGHCHPHIVKAIARQAAVLNTNTRYLCDVVADYAQRLTADLPPHLNVCVFVNSGSEANDVAIQIARYATGNTGTLIMRDAYHGCTDATMALSPLEIATPDTVKCLDVPDMYRGPHCDDPDAAMKYAADTDRALAELLAQGVKPAAFMVDTALCSNGVVMAPDGYFSLVATKVKEAGGMIIADEVQAGMGRMGQQWGFMAQGLEPVDIITMGKPVGNAHPLGVVITNKALLDRFARDVDLFSTFGGNTVACAAGMAVLDVLERQNLIVASNEIGNYFRARLHALAQSQPLIGDVRGKGMLIGLELVTDRVSKAPATSETARLLELMRQHRVLVGSSGPASNVLKLRPALIYTEENVDFFIDALDLCLTELSRAHLSTK